MTRVGLQASGGRAEPWWVAGCAQGYPSICCRATGRWATPQTGHQQQSTRIFTRVEDLWVIFYLGLEFRAETLIPWFPEAQRSWKWFEEGLQIPGGGAVSGQ